MSSSLRDMRYVTVHDLRLTNVAHVYIEFRLPGIRWPSRSRCWRCIQTNRRSCSSISERYCQMARFRYAIVCKAGLQGLTLASVQEYSDLASYTYANA